MVAQAMKRIGIYIVAIGINCRLAVLSLLYFRQIDALLLQYRYGVEDADT
jgi:hypothetical protein